jgi:TolB-like protein/Flp pilus assembly protein TadD
MKRCPECRRDYYDDTLLYCLDDGNALLEGPASVDEPATAILHSTGTPGEAPTRAQIQMTDQTAILPNGTGDIVPKSRGFDKRSLAVPLLLAIIVLGGFFGYRYFKPAGVGQINSIAVLPFVNASGDQETDFLSDGIAETLINNFTKIPSLRVTARSTAFRYKGKDTDPQTIGKELNVGAILTGKVIQRGDTLSIQVDLIDTSNGSQLWGNRYSGKTSEILNLQQSMAREVSDQLKLKLSGVQAQQIAKNYTANPEAYQLYLKGRFYWNKRTAENLKKAIAEFKAAEEKDPNYALALVGLADCYALMEQYAGAKASETLPQAKAFVTRALAIDDSLAEAHISSGFISNHLWDWADAEREYKLGLALNPNYPTGHQWYGLHLKDVGRFDEAATEANRALELDPLSNVIRGSIALLYLEKKDAQRAVEFGLRSIELDPSYGSTHSILAFAYLAQGRNAEAIAASEKNVELTQRASLGLGELGYVYAVTGKRVEALAVVKELEENYAKNQSSGQYIASVYAGLGQKDEAFFWLEKDFQARSGDLVRTRWRLAFESLRDDPRFKYLLKRMNLPE